MASRLHAAAFIALCTVACGPSEDARPSGPSVLLVTLDTTRADRIGAYGHASAETPTLDALSRRGILFEAAYAPTPITLPSHTSILTGTYPSEHGVRNNTLYRVADESLLLSEALAMRGYRTAAFVGSFVLAPKFGLDQGFEVYDWPNPKQARPGTDNPLERPAGAVVDAALTWASDLEPAEPYFMWVHLFDAHSPYNPPEPYATRHEDPYDGELAYADAELGRLLGALAEFGLDDDLLVVVTADHGESLGEHGEATHGVFLYDGAMRVPLLVVPPGVADGAARRVARAVSVADVPGTILDLVGIARDAMPDARLPSLLDDAELLPGRPGRAVALETLLPYLHHRWHPLRGLVANGFKLIDSPRPELYALAEDGAESTNLAALQPELLTALREQLAALLADHGPLGWATAYALSDADRENLLALGYAGSNADGSPFDAELPLPMDRVGDLAMKAEAVALILEGSGHLRRGDRSSGEAAMTRARELLTALLAENSADPQATSSLGMLEMSLGRFDAALAPLELHALTVPTDPRTHQSLAECYALTGKHDWSIAEMMKAVTVDRRFGPAYRGLAELHAARGEYGHALWWLTELESVSAEREGSSAELQAHIRSMRRAAEQSGQSGVAPAGFPARDLRPESVIHRP
jgi:arylsulfatase A-like enzyme